MKKITAFLLFTSLCTTIQAQFNADKEPFLTQSLTEYTIEKVYARTSGGNIEVTGITTGQTRIEVYVRPSNYKQSEGITKEEIKRRLEADYELTISGENNQLHAVAKQHNSNIMNWKNHLSISFKVFVRENVSTDLHTSGGSIRLSNLSGNQNFKTSGGSLHLDKLIGMIHGRTSGGSIHVSNSGKNLNLKTSGGSIHANNCNGTIELATSGGSLNLSNLNGIIDARTSGGSVRGNNIKGELKTHTSGGSIRLNEMTCSLDASTSGGGIDVDITTLGKYVKLSNSSGSINLKIPGKTGLDLALHASKISTGNLTNFNGKQEDDELSGTLNGGGIPVNVRAGSGRISLSFN